MLFQLGETLMPAVPANQLRVEELLGIKRLPVLEDAVNGASKLLGDDREGFGLAVFADQPLVELFGWAVGSEEQTGSLTESPLEVDVADLGVLHCRLDHLPGQALPSVVVPLELANIS